MQCSNNQNVSESAKTMPPLFESGQGMDSFYVDQKVSSLLVSENKVLHRRVDAINTAYQVIKQSNKDCRARRALLVKKQLRQSRIKNCSLEKTQPDNVKTTFHHMVVPKEILRLIQKLNRIFLKISSEKYPSVERAPQVIVADINQMEKQIEKIGFLTKEIKMSTKAYIQQIELTLMDVVEKRRFRLF